MSTHPSPKAPGPSADTDEVRDEGILESLGEAVSEPVRDAAASAPASPEAPSGSGDPLADIYHALRHGRGRERVDDRNVDELIRMAHERGDAQLEYLLREWRAPCGDDPDAPARAQLQRIPPPG